MIGSAGPSPSLRQRVPLKISHDVSVVDLISSSDDSDRTLPLDFDENCASPTPSASSVVTCHSLHSAPTESEVLPPDWLPRVYRKYPSTVNLRITSGHSCAYAIGRRCPVVLISPMDGRFLRNQHGSSSSGDDSSSESGSDSGSGSFHSALTSQSSSAMILDPNEEAPGMLQLCWKFSRLSIQSNPCCSLRLRATHGWWVFLFKTPEYYLLGMLFRVLLLPVTVLSVPFLCYSAYIWFRS